MYLNRNAFIELVKTKFANNYHECARCLDVDVSTVSRVINGNNNAGTKFLGGLMAYCANNSLSFESYIFLQKPLLESNEIDSA